MSRFPQSRLSVPSPAPQSSGDQLDGDCHHGSHQVRQSEVDPPKRDVISCQPVQAASMWERKTFERFRDCSTVLFSSHWAMSTLSPVPRCLAPIDFTAGVVCSAPAPPLIKQSIYRAPGKPDIRTAAAVAAGLDDGGGKRGRVR